jgi:CheY-like chemotaxis protein
MGGDLTIKNTGKQGTIFQFDLQIIALAAPHKDTILGPSQIIGLAPNQPRYRLLVADDSIENRKLLLKLLEPIGFAMKEASNGQESLDIWAQWQPHLIWMDMRMPVLDGREATKQIRATPQGQTTVIIALSASAFEEERTEVMALGCNDFVRKPFKEEEIFEMLSQHLGVRFITKPLTSSFQSPENEPLQLTRLQTLLDTIPFEVVTNLEKAAELCDMAGIDQAIRAIGHHNAQLAATLADLAADFEYDKLLLMAQTAKRNK